MGPEYHRVCIYTHDVPVSNQKDFPQQETAILSDATDRRVFGPLKYLHIPSLHGFEERLNVQGIIPHCKDTALYFHFFWDIFLVGSENNGDFFQNK
jgi:hypothetical protein